MDADAAPSHAGRVAFRVVRADAVAALKRPGWLPPLDRLVAPSRVPDPSDWPVVVTAQRPGTDALLGAVGVAGRPLETDDPPDPDEGVWITGLGVAPKWSTSRLDALLVEVAVRESRRRGARRVRILTVRDDLVDGRSWEWVDVVPSPGGPLGMYELDLAP